MRVRFEVGFQSVETVLRQIENCGVFESESTDRAGAYFVRVSFPGQSEVKLTDVSHSHSHTEPMPSTRPIPLTIWIQIGIDMHVLHRACTQIEAAYRIPQRFS